MNNDRLVIKDHHAGQLMKRIDSLIERGFKLEGTKTEKGIHGTTYYAQLKIKKKEPTE